MHEIAQEELVGKLNVEKTTLLGERVNLLQPKDGLRAGLDSVFLSAAVQIQEGESGLDLGCGVGTVGLCVAKRLNKPVHITGIEYQQELADLAKENAGLNNCDQSYTVIHADFRECGLPENSFDHVFMNPPFMEAGSYIESPKESRNKAIGHQNDEATLEEWIHFGFDMLSARGTITIIHRADALQRIVVAMGKKFGALEIFPLIPKQGDQAKRVIVRAMKHRKSPSTIHNGIILHKEDGSYTDKAEDILRKATGI